MPRSLYRSPRPAPAALGGTASAHSGGSLYEQVGGEEGLRHIVGRFVDRAFDDAMIGFLFRGADRGRVKRLEFEFASQHLGGPGGYTGRSLQSAHKAHPIERGHFDRRLQLLKEELQRAGAPNCVIVHWLEHTEARRSLVQAPRLACGPEATASKPSRGTGM